ncbi:MAG: N-formylglutamate amidohydrolase, partial [Oscillospiraceae bacterium]|nr:N-formylglutamate amidohydrolase [Oscillospiraceae bacterium]
MFSPVLIHVPHSSVNIPPKYRQTFLADIETELGFMTDWYTDELLSCRHESLIFPVSRLVCDVERFRDDSEEVMSARGMGAVYE